MSAATAPVSAQPQKLEKKPIKFSNLLLGAGLNLFEVTTLGQPLEVIKTTMAANRGDGFATSLGRIWSRGEASTKGAVLLFVASEAEYYARSLGASEFGGGIIGGVVGGVTFMDIFRREGIRSINKGVHAGARFGLSRLSEQGIRKVTNKDGGEKLSALEKITASALGGGLSAWNQPIEVIRVEMQSKKEDPNRPKKMTVGNTFKYIYQTNRRKGLCRGVTPRIGLSMRQTVCMVAMGDMAKTYIEKLTGDTVTAKH
ncbi:mitochondrial carrier domain-containing protein [Colletotrichum cereale]|nr:mitochondrial carrier domain-containing protein [Colletotrichum cereale]